MATDPGNDGAVLDLLVTRTLCVECVGRKTNLPVSDIDAVLGRLRRTLRLRGDLGRCEECRRYTVVHSLG